MHTILHKTVNLFARNPLEDSYHLPS